MSVSIHPDQDDDMLGPLDSCASSARIPAWRSAAVRPRMAARNWRGADPATGQIVCLRLTGQLCADTAQALLDAVGARVRAAVTPPCAVVLDLSDTLAADDDEPSAITLSWWEAWTLSTARSVCGSRPVIVADSVWPSENSTSTEPPPLAAIEMT